ncbi:MAG: hypothetical protein IJJ88_02980 [Oscillospiraceae bacterium]|nr:hypothetical protein [Oscillospiraceae bacterium]
MVDLKKTSDALCRLAAENGAQGFSATVFTREKQELNTENDQFSLYRTTFDHGAALTVLTEGRKGAASGNDLSDEGLAALASSAMASAASSQPDEANAIAPCQGSHTFHNGPFAPDMPRFYDRLTEFLAAVARDYPQVKLMAMIADHTATHTLYANHNGTAFENFDGVYHVVLEFAGNDGARTTGFHDAAVAFHDLDTPIMALGNVAQALRDAHLDGEFVVYRWTDSNVPRLQVWCDDAPVSPLIDILQVFNEWQWSPDNTTSQDYWLGIQLNPDGSADVQTWGRARVADWIDGGVIGY